MIKIIFWIISFSKKLWFNLINDDIYQIKSYDDDDPDYVYDDDEPSLCSYYFYFIFFYFEVLL